MPLRRPPLLRLAKGAAVGRGGSLGAQGRGPSWLERSRIGARILGHQAIHRQQPMPRTEGRRRDGRHSVFSTSTVSASTPVGVRW